ncbi:uracil-DNA glycosylase family protein [Undibacterium sp.]|uniref:uracil-DNA glycosylase family protein n=1 Tax=Undibacterium sp. TaxID=1914977 RepID=UPI0025E8B7CC|nr:uracil-DNA glycosylase family protein [Undibacterium sp.]
MNDKRDFLLSEMSLGPLWKLRHDAPIPVQGASAVEPPVTPVTPVTPVNSEPAPALLQNEDETAAFALFLNEEAHQNTTERTESADNSVPVGVAGLLPVLGLPDLTEIETPQELATSPVPRSELDAGLDLAWSSSAAGEDHVVSAQGSVSNGQVIGHAACLCGLSEKPEQALFRADRAKPDYLFVYCDAAGGARRHQAAASAQALFENMLLAMGVQRGAKAYLSNVLIAAPELPRGKDVTALAAEYSLCLPCLRRQIKLMQPSVLVALGSTVAGALLNTDTAAVMAMRGGLQQFEGLPLVLSDDPRYLLTKPVAKARVWADLCLAINSLASN